VDNILHGLNFTVFTVSPESKLTKLNPGDKRKNWDNLEN